MAAKFPPNPGRRLAAAVVALCLLSAACSSGAPDPASEGVGDAQAEASAGATLDNDKSEPGDKGEGKSESSGGKNDDGDKGPGNNSDDPEGDDRGVDEGSNDDDGSAKVMAVPEAGKIRYFQTGWEELCQAGNCSRDDLPSAQTVTMSISEKDSSHAVFTSKSEGSGSQEQTITYESGPGRVSVTLLESRFSSNGFGFTTEISPDPAVLAARLPFEVGDGWSGEWQDRNGEVDGSYRFDVVRKETMTINGEQREAIVLDSFMELTGEYSGTNELRLWILPDTFQIVASKGYTDIDSQFGTYRSKFATSYSSGPN